MTTGERWAWADHRGMATAEIGVVLVGVASLVAGLGWAFGQGAAQVHCLDVVAAAARLEARGDSAGLRELIGDHRDVTLTVSHRDGRTRVDGFAPGPAWGVIPGIDVRASAVVSDELGRR